MVELFQDKQVTIREYNTAEIKKLIESYLIANSIAGENYVCDRVDCARPDCIQIHLSPAEGGCIDEDFEGDKNWDAFCNQLAETLGVRWVSAPYWYYPK